MKSKNHCKYQAPYCDTPVWHGVAVSKPVHDPEEDDVFPEFLDFERGWRKLAFFYDPLPEGGFIPRGRIGREVAAGRLVAKEMRIWSHHRGHEARWIAVVFVTPPGETWRLGKAMRITRILHGGKPRDRDWPDRAMAELIGYSVASIRVYLARGQALNRRWRLERLRKQRRRLWRRPRGLVAFRSRGDSGRG